MSETAADTADHLRRMASRLVRDGSISLEEVMALRHAAAIVDFVAQHSEGLRVLVNRLRPEVAAVALPRTDTALANLPEVRAVLDAFPGSAIAEIADLAPIPAPEGNT